jgi:AcrR family transcriptional regulator
MPRCQNRLLERARVVRRGGSGRTRRAIVEAARELFLVQGFEATTLNEIAARADVANSTLFTHFASKQDVFFADYELFIEDFIQVVEKADPARESAVEATIRWHNEAIVAGGIDIDPVWFDNIRRLIDEEPLLIALERQLYERGELVLAKKLAVELGESTERLSLRVRMIPSAISTFYHVLARFLAEHENADVAEMNRYVDDCIRGMAAGMLAIPQSEPND